MARLSHAGQPTAQPGDWQAEAVVRPGDPCKRWRSSSIRWSNERMPELPDITLYLEALRARILGRALERIRVVSPFLLRSVDTPIDSRYRTRASSICGRLGKRIAIGFE